MCINGLHENDSKQEQTNNNKRNLKKHSKITKLQQQLQLMAEGIQYEGKITGDLCSRLILLCDWVESWNFLGSPVQNNREHRESIARNIRKRAAMNIQRSLSCRSYLVASSFLLLRFFESSKEISFFCTSCDESSAKDEIETTRGFL